MTREYHIPGGPGVQETGTRQYQIPGWQGINETTAAGAAPQLAYPIADIAAGGWLPSTGSDIYPLLADGGAGVPNDADFGFTLLPGQTYKFRLTPVTDPGVSTGHKYRYRAYSPQSATLQFDIYAAATFIATRQQALTPGVTQYEVTLTGPETDLIPTADYDELYGWATGVAP